MSSMNKSGVRFFSLASPGSAEQAARLAAIHAAEDLDTQSVKVLTALEHNLARLQEMRDHLPEGLGPADAEILETIWEKIATLEVKTQALRADMTGTKR